MTGVRPTEPSLTEVNFVRSRLYTDMYGPSSPTSYLETVVLLSVHVDVCRCVSPKIKGGYQPCLEVTEMML